MKPKIAHVRPRKSGLFEVLSKVKAKNIKKEKNTHTEVCWVFGYISRNYFLNYLCMNLSKIYVIVIYPI